MRNPASILKPVVEREASRRKMEVRRKLGGRKTFSRIRWEGGEKQRKKGKEGKEA